MRLVFSLGVQLKHYARHFVTHFVGADMTNYSYMWRNSRSQFSRGSSWCYVSEISDLKTTHLHGPLLSPEPDNDCLQTTINKKYTRYGQSDNYQQNIWALWNNQEEFSKRFAHRVEMENEFSNAMFFRSFYDNAENFSNFKTASTAVSFVLQFHRRNATFLAI